MSFSSGTRLGPYEIVAPLGAGGMGEVYRARDPRLRRDVAVKVLPPEVAGDPDRLARFEDEARAASALNHPHLLTVFDVGEQDGTPYLVTELLDGETLRERLRDGALPQAQALDLAVQLARGLAAAHEHGVVHRDLKPENVLVTREGRVKILDFGLAKATPAAEASDVAQRPTRVATAPGTVVGSPGYMAPEQVRGLPVDRRADVFAFGAIVFEMLTGRRAFPGATAADALAAVLRVDPFAGDGAGGLQSGLRSTLKHCLAKEPGDRFASLREVLAALPAAGERRAEAPSVAVLPFADLSPAGDQEYFCDGVADELASALSGIRGLRVAARSSAFQFRGGGVDVREIGARLGVATVLDGSVRRAGDRLRVAVQLARTDDGYQTWSRRFDRELRDVFEVQEEIARLVAQELRGVLTAEDRRALQRPAASDVAAYELYLRGRQLFFRSNRREIEAARELFRAAIALDPGYALAFSGLADCGGWLYNWWGGDPADFAEADRASARALELAPDLAEAHAARGEFAALDARFADAEAEFEAALRLKPELFEAFYYYGRACYVQGDLERTAELWERAAAARPEDYQCLLLVGTVYDALGRQEEKRRALERGLERARRHLAIDPQDHRAVYLAAGAFEMLGDAAQARAWSERALAAEPDDPAVQYNVACVLARLGDRDAALDLLERSLRDSWGQRGWIVNDPDLASLRGDPRYEELLERLR